MFITVHERVAYQVWDRRTGRFLTWRVITWRLLGIPIRRRRHIIAVEA